MTRKEEILFNLSQYLYISKFFGPAIRKRMEIEGYTRGMLTAYLLDGESSKKDIESLECVLHLGENNCTNFEYIFKEMGLPNQDLAIDAVIINTLAEVKAFEYLHKYGFKDINRIKRERNVKTVDFTAKKDNQNYAIEVTRLGLTISDRKKPKLDKLSDPPLLTIINSKEPQNKIRIMNDIYDKVIDKYPQIREFCQRQDNSWRGILVISNGRDYFVSGKYENKLYELNPQNVANILQEEWRTLTDGKEQQYEYLHHILITMGKNIAKTVIYPEL